MSPTLGPFDRIPGLGWLPQYWCWSGAALRDPDLLVMHCGSVGDNLAGYLRDPRCAPQTPGARRCSDGLWRRTVSAHLAWLPDSRLPAGGLLVQGVALSRQAWHAGGSRWRGRGAVNARSIGIELAGPPTRARGEAETAALREAVSALLVVCPSLRWWTRHSAIQPGKGDPGAGLSDEWAAGLLEYAPAG